MTTLASISSSQLQKEVTANENFIALSPAGMFGRRYAGISGLTWAYYGGILFVDGVATPISDGTVALTNSATNYIERTRAGTVSANTSGFTAGRVPLYTAVTSGGAITSYTDYRDLTTPLQKGRVGVTVTTADVTLSAAEARVDEVKATGTLTGNRSIIVPAVAWAWIVDNATAGAFALTVKTAAGSGVVVPQGTATVVYCDGTDVKSALSGVAGNLTVGGTLTVDTIVSTATTATVFHTVATTVNAFGAATTLTIGGATNRLTVASSNLLGNIYVNTADASDSGELRLAPTNGIGATRGAYIRLFGNESAATGAVTVAAGNVSGGNINFLVGNAITKVSITNALNVVLNAQGGTLATTATDGFTYLPTCAGTPTGVPTAVTGAAPAVIDSTNNKLYFYSGGAWRDAGP